MPKVHRVLAPIDFSEHSMAALEYASWLAQRLGADVDALHVWEAPSFVASDMLVARPGLPPQPLLELARQEAERSMAALLLDRELRGLPAVGSRVLAGHPGYVIVEVARAGAYDMVVVGTHGRTGLSRLLVGSVAERVARHAHCPVVTVPPGGLMELTRPASPDHRLQTGVRMASAPKAT